MRRHLAKRHPRLAEILALCVVRLGLSGGGGIDNSLGFPCRGFGQSFLVAFGNGVARVGLRVDVVRIGTMFDENDLCFGPY